YRNYPRNDVLYRSTVRVRRDWGFPHARRACHLRFAVLITTTEEQRSCPVQRVWPVIRFTPCLWSFRSVFGPSRWSATSFSSLAAGNLCGIRSPFIPRSAESSALR